MDLEFKMEYTPVWRVKDTIIDYRKDTILKYDTKGNPTTYIRTTIEFLDGTESISCPENEYDEYNGFCICFAKHMARKCLKQDINDLAKYWTVTVPKKKQEEQLKKDMEIAEKQRIELRNKKRREKNRIRMEAIKRKETYEAVKLAEEKYGVPSDWFTK